jgi:diguanylate cyclase (GGDEF)-like protein
MRTSYGPVRGTPLVAGLVLGGLALLAGAAVAGGVISVVALVAGALLGATVVLAALPHPAEAHAAPHAPAPAPQPPTPAPEAPAPAGPVPEPAPAPELLIVTDPITGLPAAEQLHADLHTVLADARDDRAWTLYIFALDGFKDYNDAYGDACGDALLAWLARKLAGSVGEHAIAYRMRGGSFGLLAVGPEQLTASVRDAAVAALHEIGEGFHISCGVGTASLPSETRVPELALELALRRAHSNRTDRPKPGLRAPADATEALRLVRPRYDMAALARRIARRLEVPPADIEHLEAAVHLCDVGTLAVPREVLGRAGKLPDDEWHFILLHTLVGERLLAAGLGMEAVAALVRSSHERWDGAGYPDGLAGEAIPLGSRIVFVCSAFHDMTSDRPHQPALEPAEAMAELERGAGTQFDPDVVSAFREELGFTFDEAAPVDEPPADETAGDEPPAGETAGDEPPAGETLADEPSADEALAGETAGDEASVDETAGDEVPADGAPPSEIGSAA